MKSQILGTEIFFYYKKKLKNFWHQSSDLSLVSSFGYATFVKNRFEVYKYLKKKRFNLDL